MRFLSSTASTCLRSSLPCGVRKPGRRGVSCVQDLERKTLVSRILS